MAVEYIGKNPIYFKEYMFDTNIESYCQMMSKDTNWGGEAEMKALGKAL